MKGLGILPFRGNLLCGAMALPSNGITYGDCGAIFVDGGNSSPHMWDWLYLRFHGNVMMKYDCPQEVLANIILGHCVWAFMFLLQSLIKYIFQFPY